MTSIKLSDVSNEAKALLVERQMKLEVEINDLRLRADNTTVPEWPELYNTAADALQTLRDQMAALTPRRFKGLGYPLNDKKEDW